jgi:hypothetical protein
VVKTGDFAVMARAFAVLAADLEGGEQWTETFQASRIKVDCNSRSSGKGSGLGTSSSSCSNCC